MMITKMWTWLNWKNAAAAMSVCSNALCKRPTT